MLKELLKLSNGKELDVKFPIKLYDSNGNNIYYEDSVDHWCKREFDSNCNFTFYENSDKFWCKSEYDSNGKETYCEDSNGKTSGTKRQEVEELTVADIEKLLNKKIKIVK